MTDEIKRIHKNISAVYDGQPWYGDNICTILEGISAEMALVRPANLNHSIAEIVAHMTAWHYFVIEKMKGNAAYEVWQTELDWQKIDLLNEDEWERLQNGFSESHAKLLAHVEQMQESILTQPVDGRKYNFRLMLQGIAQHDIYHAGQISLIKKLTDETNLSIARKWFEAFAEKNVDKLVSLYHEEAEHYSPKLKVHQPQTKGLIKGKAAMRAWWSEAFDRLSSLRYEVLSLTTHSDRVFMEYIRHVNGEEDMRVGEVLEIKYGKITASRVFHS